MKNNHLDILFMENAARRRGYSLAQMRAALEAYNNGGLSARRLLATLGLLPKMPDPEPELSEEEIAELKTELTRDVRTDEPKLNPPVAPEPVAPAPPIGTREIPIKGDVS